MTADERGTTLIALALFAAGSNALALWTRWGHKRKLQLVRVGVVEAVQIFPVKSCGGFEVDQAVCDETGIESLQIRDRHFAVITSESSDEPGRVLTQRVFPQMALVKLCVISNSSSETTKHNNGVTICFSAANMPDLQLSLPLVSTKPAREIEAKLWGQKIYGRDCGSEAATWWNKYLQRDDLILLHAEKDYHLKPLLTTTSKMPSNVVDRLDGDKTAYKDWSPIHVANLASLDDLNARINAAHNGQQDGPIKINNFRPNIVIRTNVPFEEDNFDRIFIGSSEEVESLSKNVPILRHTKQCDRCLLTTVNPQKGERRTDGEPLKTLRSFRLQEPDYGKSPLFGIDCCVDRPGRVKKGDIVYASLLRT